MTTIAPPAAREDARVELTVRGVIMGVLITLLFTAANVYLGLKVALTFATSIPAAVISMAVLRAFTRNATIVENNIVQTVASAAGAMASVVFVLPGLVIIGAWSGFPFWTTFGVCAAGGVLGVMYTIPLRRAMVTQSDLPYPEGVAAAEVLIVGSGAHGDSPEAEADSRKGLLVLVAGAVTAAAYAALTAMQVFAGEVSRFVRTANDGATGLGAQMSLALLGAGHLVGIAVGAAQLVGLIITWGVAVPLLTAHAPPGEAAALAQTVWSHKVRFLGAGAIGVSALWTLAKLAVPLVTGVTAALAAQRKRGRGEGEVLPRIEQDIPINTMALISLVCLVPIAVVLAVFLSGGPLGGLVVPLTIAALAYIVIAGFAVAAVCGYMAGLIGSSNSPVSGMAILSVLGAALLIAAVGLPILKGGDARPLIAFSLLVTSVLISVAISANDNLQDLKTGQLVDATPWRQQVALVIGVVAGSVAIPLVLNLLNRAYGFAGAPTHGIAGQPLAAPQATLITTIASGVIGGNLQWGLIGVGALIGAGLVAVDELLRRTGRYSLPPLGAAIAIYLPSSVTVPVIIGAFAGWIFKRRTRRGASAQSAERLGVLMASGLIVGDSLLNVAYAGLIAATGKGAPLAIVPETFAPASPLAVGAYLAVMLGLYLWTARQSRS
ncbi:MAG TPA: oligopeptide transporter, OPT family [Phenylobacterium sp.]|uniref:OPT family oligopeptide transporter n=1 Tax=Phenylobacterium sp. TaxID=1871053 RepID=UPI002B495FD2|nr:oligopeptide transporter, OPT family [Phenylobacterium sp.]HKR87936.1 oligopeptide transporter, OPT family [Phenylobacterium sp.]